MITTSKRTIKELWRTDRRFLFLMLFISIVVYYVNKNYNLSLRIPSGSLQVTGLFIAFFLVFMSKKSYERWWEARIIWGDIVNKSRSWAMQVNHLINDKKIPLRTSDQDFLKIKQKLIYRQISFVNALRLHLRRQDNFSELKKYISEEEYSQLKNKTNIPTHILDIQAKDIDELIPGGVEGTIVQTELNKILKDLYDFQGMSERIKNTVFPKPYGFFARAIGFVYILILPFYLIRRFLGPEISDLDFFAIPLVIFICLVFYSLTKLSEQYEKPFENSPHDIPLTEICRTIEVDLKELLGEETPIFPGPEKEGVIY
jgi:ion channel-forming bestrophin family protein